LSPSWDIFSRFKWIPCRWTILRNIQLSEESRLIEHCRMWLWQFEHMSVLYSQTSKGFIVFAYMPGEQIYFSTLTKISILLFQQVEWRWSLSWIVNHFNCFFFSQFKERKEIRSGFAVWRLSKFVGYIYVHVYETQQNNGTLCFSISRTSLLPKKWLKMDWKQNKVMSSWPEFRYNSERFHEYQKKGN